MIKYCINCGILTANILFYIWFREPRVVGSSPTLPTKLFGEIAQLAEQGYVKKYPVFISERGKIL